MRVLIIGGGGFLGSTFAALARSAGHEVTTLDRGGEVDLVCDIGDPAAVARAVAAAAPEAVVHLAALLTDDCAADPVEATRVNALGTAAVFAAASKVPAERVLYASSVAAVGPCPEGSGDAVPLAPANVYGATKAFGEHLARALAGVPGAPRFAALRFGWIYGAGRARGWRTPQEVIERFARGDARVEYADFAEPIDWTYIDDAAEVLLRLLAAPLPRFAAFNVAGDRRATRDVVAHLRRRFPAVEAVARPAASPPAGWGFANDGLAAAIGYVPATRLEDGIERMLAALGAPKAP